MKKSENLIKFIFVSYLLLLFIIYYSSVSLQFYHIVFILIFIGIYWAKPVISISVIPGFLLLSAVFCWFLSKDGLKFKILLTYNGVLLVVSLIVLILMKVYKQSIIKYGNDSFLTFFIVFLSLAILYPILVQPFDKKIMTDTSISKLVLDFSFIYSKGIKLYLFYLVFREILFPMIIKFNKNDHISFGLDKYFFLILLSGIILNSLIYLGIRQGYNTYILYNKTNPMIVINYFYLAFLFLISAISEEVLFLFYVPDFIKGKIKKEYAGYLISGTLFCFFHFNIDAIRMGLVFVSVIFIEKAVYFGLAVIIRNLYKNIYINILFHFLFNFFVIVSLSLLG